MPNPENVIGRGNRFTSSNQPRHNGRKPSALKQLRFDCGVELSREDYQKIIGYLLERTVQELEAIQSSPDTPSFVVSIINALFFDMKTGRIQTLDALLDRLFGKPNQCVKNHAEIELRGSIPIRSWIADRLRESKVEQSRG